MEEIELDALIKVIHNLALVDIDPESLGPRIVTIPLPDTSLTDSGGEKQVNVDMSSMSSLLGAVEALYDPVTNSLQFPVDFLVDLGNYGPNFDLKDLSDAELKDILGLEDSYLITLELISGEESENFNLLVSYDANLPQFV